MVITNNVQLPTFEEMECEEVNLGPHVLKAGAFQLGKYCEEKNDEFMLCRQELGRHKCIPEGKEVTACTLEFFRKLKKSCFEELDRYSHCIDKSSDSFNYYTCRKTQAVFDECVLENFGIERPIYWYFSRPRVFDSKKRPKPEPLPEPVFANRPVAPIPEEGLPDPVKPKFNSRFWFFT